MADKIIYKQQVSEEENIYIELVAIYLETQDTGYVSESVWQRVNSLLKVLSIKNPRYNDYLLSTNNVAKSILLMTFKQKLRSAISVLGNEYGLEDLTDIVRRNRPEGSMNIQNSATSSPTQNVRQDTKVMIDQQVALVVKEIEQNLTDEQIKTVKPLIDEYKKKPTRNAAEKLLSGIFDLGKDIGVGIIANILSKQMGI